MSIRLVLRRGAGLLAAAGLLAGLSIAAPTAQAVERPAATRPAGNVYQGLGYVPKSVKRGQSIVVNVWFMQRSPDTMQLMAAGVSIDPQNPASGRGVRVDWLDPVTKRWEPTTGNMGYANSYYRQLPTSPRLDYRSGVWGHISMRITFTSRAHLGDWYMSPNTPYEYQLWTKSGQPVADGYLFQPTSTVGVDINVRA